MIFWSIGFAVVAVVLYTVFMTIRMVRYMTTSKAIVRKHQPFSHTPPKARQHILIIGDSTMYGAGIEDRAYTIGGLFAKTYPGASIETLAINGACVRDVHQQLAKAQHKHYDIIMLGIGGNDVVRCTIFSRVRKELRALLAETSPRTDRLIVCNSVNIGNIGFFFFPLNYLYDYRSRDYARLCHRTIAQFPNATFVDLYRPLKDDHYNKQTRQKFLASDAFHANEYANQHFFEIICKEAGLPKAR